MPQTALQYLLKVHHYGAGGFWSTENPKAPASNSELRRWINQKCLLINDEAVTVDEVLDFPLHSVILFPKSKKRITLL